MGLYGGQKAGMGPSRYQSRPYHRPNHSPRLRARFRQCHDQLHVRGLPQREVPSGRGGRVRFIPLRECSTALQFTYVEGSLGDKCGFALIPEPTLRGLAGAEKQTANSGGNRLMSATWRERTSRR